MNAPAPGVTADGLVLTTGQNDAYGKFISFLMNPSQRSLVISGYAGTGKSTLVGHILDTLNDLLKTSQLLSGKEQKYKIVLTATTNKAAEALSDISGYEVQTIHSLLHLVPKRDFNKNRTVLTQREDYEPLKHKLIVIDEASYIDAALMKYLGHLDNTNKIVYIGDPAQLTPVGYQTTPIFEAPIERAELTEVVRQQDGNPIIELATKFRNVVNGEPWFQFKPDGHHIQYLERDHFEVAIQKEFCRKDWKYKDSKILAWTNNAVIAYNKGIRELAHGDPELQIHDYAVCNSYISNKQCRLKTDQLVQLTGKTPANDRGYPGWAVVLDHHHFAFMPQSRTIHKQAIKDAEDNKDTNKLLHIEQHWIDLRAAYACTINKSQGSTYDAVFIDLDNVAKCHSGNQIARMMYVAVSRAREHVYLTGDLG